MPQPEAGNCHTGSCDRWTMVSSCTRKSLSTKRPLLLGCTSVLHAQWKGYVKCSTQIWMWLALCVGGAGCWISCMRWSCRGKMVQMRSSETVSKWSITKLVREGLWRPSGPKGFHEVGPSWAADEVSCGFV